MAELIVKPTRKSLGKSIDISEVVIHWTDYKKKLNVYNNCTRHEFKFSTKSLLYRIRSPWYVVLCIVDCAKNVISKTIQSNSIYNNKKYFFSLPKSLQIEKPLENI